MRPLALMAVAALTCTFASPSQALIPGQADTFTAGLEGWFTGGGPGGGTLPSSPAFVAGGGPSGAGDAFMQLAATGGGGAGSRLAVINGTQWAGNYLTAGVTGIDMHLKNLGVTDLAIRLVFERLGSAGPTDLAVTSFASLPAGGDWTRVHFAVTESDLQVLDGDASALLSGTSVIRIFHNVDAAFPPDAIVGTLGVDNITAVPEPTTLGLMLAGLGLVGVRRWMMGRKS